MAAAKRTGVSVDFSILCMKEEILMSMAFELAVFIAPSHDTATVLSFIMKNRRSEKSCD